MEIENKEEENSIWCEKYRPRKFDDYVGNDQMIDKFRSFVTNQDIPHILLFSTPGTGKTTAGHILTNEIECDCLYINASDENNVETIRTKVKSFATTGGFKPWKVVFLDECLEETTLVCIKRDDVEQLVEIRYLKENSDLVKSFNFDTNEQEWKPFNLWKMGNKPIYQVHFENGEMVRCTEDHKWYVYVDKNNWIPNKIKYSSEVKFKNIYKLKLTDIINDTRNNRRIVTTDSTGKLSLLKIEKIVKTHLEIPVFDLSVENNHNFYITNKQILTSNCDGITFQGQDLLRNLMETYSGSTRFILTANYIEKIRPAIQSRCQVFNVVPPSKKDIAKRIVHILDTEQVTYDLKDLKVLVDTNYPDIRKIINACQQNTINGTLTLNKQNLIEGNYILKILEILKDSKKKPKESLTEIRQLIADSQVRDFTPLYQLLYDEVDNYSNNKSAEVILKLAEYEYQSNLRVIKELSASALLISILEIIR
jgi:DNA polymerase III delta prime subunit